MLSHEPAQNRSKVVLVADDAPENLVILKAIVEKAGYTFIGAETGCGCLTIASRVTPRLILLDIQMPDMNGFEACRRLRTMPELRRVPIMFLTASHSADDVREGIAAGGNDFVVRPFHPIKLLERVQHWTTRRVDSNAV